MPRKHLLIVAAKTGYQTRMFAQAAARLDVDVSLATDRCHMLEDPWGDQAIPVHFDALEDSAAEVAAGRRFDAVAAVGDRPAVLAAMIAERAGATFHSVAAVRAATNKFTARESFRAAGLPVPAYVRIPLAAAPPDKIHYPCVLKPLGLSASRGVIRANNPPEFAAAFARIRNLLRQPDLARLRDPAMDFIQVEDFLPGREFALEGLVTGGQLQVLALFDKPDPLDGPYFEETIYVTPSREPESVKAAIFAAAQHGVTALGLTQGPVHAEMRVDGGQVWMLEVAPRPIGGLCAKALVFEGGMPLEVVIVRHALGEVVNGLRLEPGASGVMMIPVPKTGIFRGVGGLEQAAAMVDEVIVTAKEGQRVAPLPEGNSYLGFIFARALSSVDSESRLRQAHAALCFDIVRSLPLAPVTRGAAGSDLAGDPH